MRSTLRPWIGGLLDFFFPRYCIVCDDVLSESEQYVCVKCFMTMPRTGFHLEHDNIMEKSLWGKIPIGRATSFMFYKEDFKKIVLSLKYRHKHSIGIYIGMLMAKEISSESDFFNGIDAIVPIPIHWKRKLHRGYNQSYYLAKGLHFVTGIPIYDNVVRRTVNNPSQTRMNRSERKTNVENIFRCHAPEQLRGKHILLLDDVRTTGATSLSCAISILKALGEYNEKGANVSGSVKISILTLAIANKTMYK